MKHLILFIFVLVSALSCLSFGAEEIKRRHLELELEEVPDVKGYEVRLTRLKEGVKKTSALFKLKTSVWAADLVPGKYLMAVRSVDLRGVPGDWSQDQEILVKIPAPEMVAPAKEEKVYASDDKKEKVKFQWKKVDGAEKYRVTIVNADQKVVDQKEIPDTDWKTPLPVANHYSWTVTPIFEKNLEGETSAACDFDLVGPKLDSPENSHLDEFNTQIILWKHAPLAEEYAYTLEEKKLDGWKVVDRKTLEKTGVKYAQALPTGEYRLRVRSLAKLREASDPLVQEFKTQNFIRSPAALEQLKSETSYDTRRKYFAMASYFVTIVNYETVNYDKNKTTSYSAVGGTGRLGFGTWFQEEGSFGVMAIADLSGYKIQDGTYVYPTVDALAVYRDRVGALGQFRFNMGVRYRELPFTLGIPNNIALDAQTKISTVGPVASATLAHAFTRTTGLQINALAYPTLIGVSVPNNQGIVSSLSYQVGLLGSMKLADSVVGFLGYAYRFENVTYNVDQNAFSSTAPPGSTFSGGNTVNLSGHYLNLLLEYGF